MKSSKNRFEHPNGAFHAREDSETIFPQLGTQKHFKKNNLRIFHS